MGRKELKYILLLLLIGFQLWLGIIPGWQKIHSDFPNYYTSSKLIAEGKDVSHIYDDLWFNEQIKSYGIEQQGKFSPFPPPTALFLLELTSFKPLTAKKIWIIVNILFLFFCALVIQKITSWKLVDCAGIILLCGLGLANNFRLGQMYLLLLLLMLTAYRFSAVQKSFSGGLLLGVGIAVKYFPVILLPAYLKDGKIIYGSVISVLLLNVIAFYFFGADVYRQFFERAFLPHLNGHLSSQSQWSPLFQSWNSFFSNLFLFDAVENPNPLLNSPVTFLVLKYAVHLLVIAVSAVTFLRLKESIHSREIAMILLTTTALLVLPASATYHYVLLVFPSVLLLQLCETSRKNALLILISFSAIGFAPAALSLFPDSLAHNLFFSFHRLWLVTVFYAMTIYTLLNLKNTLTKIN